MTYSDFLDNEGVRSQYLAILKPRRYADSSLWSLVSGTIYKQTFDHGHVVRLTADGTTKTEASFSSLSDGDWYYDADNELLYIDLGSDPANSDVVCTYELYVGTFSDHFYRIPDDNTKRQVFFEPLIVRSPRIASNTSDALFGFQPTFSTSMTLSNAVHLLEKHIYDSSWKFADVDVWHNLGELSTDNVKLVFRGLCKNIAYDEENVTLNLLDRTDLFNKNFRQQTGNSFYSFSEFSDLDPTFDRRPIRQVFGVVEGFAPVNIDYEADNPTTSTNRTWICIGDHQNLGSVSATVPASPASTSTRTYIDSADGLRIGDTFWLDSSAGAGSDEFPIITNVNKTGDNYVEHATITNPAASGSVVKRSFVGNITIKQEEKVVTALYGRDYTEYTDATNKVAGFDFTSSMEANLSLSTLQPHDIVYARIYGHTNQTTKGGSPFGSDSADTGNLSQGVVILFQLLKDSGLTESEIDLTTFTSLQSSETGQIGFAVPHMSQSNFPTYKSIINEINKTFLFKIYVNDDLEWSIHQTGPQGTVDKTIEIDEQLEKSFDYDFDYEEILSDVILEYNKREFSENHERGGDNYSRYTSTSNVARWLHLVEREKSFQSLHFIDSEAQELADHLRYILGDRQGKIRFSTKNRFFDTEIGDNIKVTRSKLPGFEFVRGTDREREMTVNGTDKGLNQINIELNDQKGIEDNSGSW